MDSTGRSPYVAFFLESGIASCVLGELVRPKHPVGINLANPVLVHVGQKIEFAIGLEPLVYGLALVRRDWCAIWLAVGGVWARLGIVLAREIAVLSV